MTTAELITRFPEFTNETTARLQLAIDDAELIVGTCFGKFRPSALAYMSAHLFVMNKQSENGNLAPSKEIASQAVGSVNVSYVVQSGNANDFGATIYGQQFDILKKRACIGSVLIG